MQINFDDRKLEKVCVSEAAMRKKLPHVATGLRRRLAALRAATNITDLRESDPLGMWHPLVGQRQGQWAGKLTGNWRLIIVPDGDAKYAAAATAVTIIDVTDYH